MPTFPLTGIDASDPRPITARELRVAQGTGGTGIKGRNALILCNKMAAIGSTTVDGLGDALDTPRLIGERQDVIDRFGYHSEALVLHDAFRAVNRVTELYMACADNGTTAATVAFTFLGASDASGTISIEALGETYGVGVANGDSAQTMAEACRDEINKRLGWPFVATSGTGTDWVLTVTASWPGLRGTHYVTAIRVRHLKPNGNTITKGAVTPGSTDDDQTNIFSKLDTAEHYYHINPKDVSTASGTDNGIGEHSAAVTIANSPSVGKSSRLFVCVDAVQATGTTVATALNSEWAHLFRTEDNDWSPGMVAAHCAAAVAYQELADAAVSMADYGLGGASEIFNIPDPFDPSDRPTSTEEKADLNNGVTPISFTSSGKAFLRWFVTTRSTTNSVQDYRARPGHVPSVMHYFWDNIVAPRWFATKQDKIAADPVDGEKPIKGFSYPRDVRSILLASIDDGVNIGLLDPGARDAMKASVEVGLLASGVSSKTDIAAVRHNLKGLFLINEVSPGI